MEIKTDKNKGPQHSENYIRMALDRERLRRLDYPDGYGIRTGDCGDTVEFFLKGNNERIGFISFQIQGCINTVACCNTVAHLASGRSVDEAWDIEPEQVIDFLETLDEAHYHCAELAVGAFYLALADMRSVLPARGALRHNTRHRY